MFLPREQPAVEAMADFSRLPFFNGQRDVNPDVANISELIVSQPFQNQNLFLQAGVHLHWMPPGALSHGVQGTETAVVFPAVPNRWLITRSRREALNWRREKQWVVESDYLYPEGQEHGSGGVTFPFDPDVAKGQRQPYRYVGRKMPLAAWNGDNDPSAEYLEKLTAVGYGETAFAAFYPNCHTVFGFHDNSISGSESVLKDLRYEIVGWYHKEQDDALHQFMKQNGPFIETDGKTSHQVLIEAIEAKFGWQFSLPQGELDKAHPDRIACFASMTFDGDRSFPTRNASSTTVSVGNTGSEALAAFVASQIDGQDNATNKAIIEDQLKALLLDDDADNTLDVGARFKEACHTNSFMASAASSQWHIRLQSASEAANARQVTAQQQAVLPDALARMLSELNDLQHAYDQGMATLKSLRSRLFTDWYKYMVCAYPPQGGGDDYPDIDGVKHFVEMKSLPQLASAQADVGLLHVQRDEQATVVDIQAHDSSSRSLAAQVAAVAKRLQQSLARHNTTLVLLRASEIRDWVKLCKTLRTTGGQIFSGLSADEQVIIAQSDAKKTAPPTAEQANILAGLNRQILDRDNDLQATLTNRVRIESALPECIEPWISIRYKLQIGPGPRYWQPREPVVLVSGPDIKLLKRAKPTPRNKVLLPCQISANEVIEDRVGKENLNSLLQQIANLKPSESSDESGFYQWDPSVKNPLLLEWEMEVMPLKRAAVSAGFKNDFITKHYLLEENSPELTAIEGKLAVAREINIYTGRSVMTDYAETQLMSRLKDFLSRQFANDFAKAAEAVETELADPFGLRAGEVSTFSDDAFGEVVAWYKAQAWRSQASHVDTFLKAVDFLRSTNSFSLSQVLGGFNAALLMQRQTLQLPATDPIGFDDYQALAHQVADSLGESRRNAPLPPTRFNPIRTGVLKVINLRLVDSFGQTQDLVQAGEAREIVKPQEFRTPRRDDLIHLPPRIVQPARLNFRWLSARHGHTEMNDHPASTPISGWLLPNNLDGSLLVYDSQGVALGYLDRQARWRLPPGVNQPEDNRNPSLDTITNQHLRKVVAYVQSNGDALFVQDFITLTNDTLEFIDPEGFAQQQSLALLMGRPIAVVRATVGLDVLGLPPMDNTWRYFRESLSQNKRDDHDFRDVEFPVRIGDFGQLNDGLVGYWQEEAGEISGSRYYANVTERAQILPGRHPGEAEVEQFLQDEGATVLRFEFLEAFPQRGSVLWERLRKQKCIAVQRLQSDSLQNDPLQTNIARSNKIVRLPDVPENLRQSVNSPPQTLTMLMDPRGVIHATCGILPSKAINIPEEQFSQAMKSIAATFLSAPILTAAEKLALPLPNESGYEWTWLEKSGDDWREVAHKEIAQVSPEATFATPQVIREGWLRLQQTDEEES